MAEIFRNYFYDPKKNKMRSRGATIAYIALYALLMVGLLGGMFALMAVGLCGPLVEGGMGWLYYLLMGLIAVFLGTFGSVFSTYSSLYLSKDNDLLLSLPIPVRCVMASRLLGVYLLGLMYAAVVIVPGVIVYWLTAPVTAGTIVGGVLMVLIVSVIVMVLSCLLGWVVARISQQGFAVVDPKRSEPVFVPWSEQIYLCTCMEGDVYSYHWIHDTILCFSNQDISGQWIERGQTVNYRQTFETDAGQPWVVALTYGSKAKCRKDAARVRQHMDGCSQQSE